MPAADWVHILGTNWLLIAWCLAGSAAIGVLIGYWTRPWWYPRIVARRVLRRSRRPG